MKKYILLVGNLILVSAVLFGQSTRKYAKAQIVVKTQNSIDLERELMLEGIQQSLPQIHELNLEYRLSKIKAIGRSNLSSTYVLFFDSEEEVDAIVESYFKTDIFEYVEPNYIGTGAGVQSLTPIEPNDDFYARQYSLKNTGVFSLATAKAGADIDMERAWEIEQGSSSIIVATLDTGLKLNHPEFEGRIWENPNESINGVDDDGDGLVDDLTGWDFANNDNNPSDDYGHGTNVTGILGANGNNNLGYAGIDWYCQLMTCKILNDENFGFYSWWADAIYYAVDKGANVLNMSVGGDSYSKMLEDAVDYAYDNGVIIVASMMNNNNNITYYPAGYKNTIAVGATNPDDTRANPFFWSNSSGSCYGNHIDVVAPGNYIYGLDYQSNTNYNSYWGGTSQATPMVSGLCALLLAQNTFRTPNEIRDIIRRSSQDKIGNADEDIAGFDPYFGHGRINAFDALSQDVTNNNELIHDKVFCNITPNPAQDIVEIKSSERLTSFVLKSVGGNTMKEGLLSGNQQQIYLSNLPAGNYILQVYLEGTVVPAVKRIILL